LQKVRNNYTKKDWKNPALICNFLRISIIKYPSEYLHKYYSINYKIVNRIQIRRYYKEDITAMEIENK